MHHLVIANRGEIAIRIARAAAEFGMQTTAIYAEDDLPEEQAHFLELNTELSKEWPVITEQKDPPPDAAEWEDKPDKLELLER